MLQLENLSAAAHEQLAQQLEFPPKWNDLHDLERVADNWIEKWLSTRRKLAREVGGLTWATEKLDRFIRTNKIEHLDDPNCPLKTKVRIVRGVHLFNVINRSYPLFVRTLKPLIEEVAERENRPARLLELASGSGEQAMSLARAVKKLNLPLTITGSDYIPEYVERSNERARKQKLELDFRVINAFDMNDVTENEFDIILICGSTHHFTPGQVARMVAGARRAAKFFFVSLDGRRGLDNLLGVVPLPLLTLQFPLLHDAWISGRKFYSRYELEHLAKIAATDASIKTDYIGPAGFLCCMNVQFSSAAA